jgi:hypothetical protein
MAEPKLPPNLHPYIWDRLRTAATEGRDRRLRVIRKPDRAFWGREWAVVLSFESVQTGDPETVVLQHTKTADAAHAIVDALRARGVERDVG